MTKLEEVEEPTTIENETRFGGFNLMQHVVRTKGTLDTVICCMDGRLGAHRIVLSAASKFLGCLIREQRNNEVIVLVLPDFRRRVIEALLCLAYTGKMFYVPEDEDGVLAAIEALQFVAEADLELSMVTVKPKPKPLPSPVVKTNVNTPGQSSRNATNQRAGSLAVRKLRVEDARQQIAKNGGTISRKRRWIQVAKNPKTIRKPLYLKSNEGSGLDGQPKTVRLNPRKLPWSSIQLSRIDGDICMERVRVQGVRFFHTEDQVEAYKRMVGLVNTKGSASSDEAENSDVSSGEDNDGEERCSSLSSSPECGDAETGQLSPNIMTEWPQRVENLHELETQPMDIGGLPSPPQSTHDDQGVMPMSEESLCHFAPQDDLHTPGLPLKPLNI